MPVTSFEAAFGPIERAHRQFSVGALGRLYPDMRGQDLARALAREMLWDAAYLNNARQRLREAVAAANGDPALTAADRDERIRRAATAERRYLQMHMEAAGNRMLREAEAAAIRSTGDPEAFWLLGQRRTHTPDCLAMEGKTWPWSVLDHVNPANRHVGCGCRLIRVAEARRLGLPIRRGYRTARVRREVGLSEARARPALAALAKIGRSRAQARFKGVAVPKFGAGAGWKENLHPRGGKGRFRKTYRVVPGHVPKQHQAKFDLFTAAVAKGDIAGARKHAEEYRQRLLADRSIVSKDIKPVTIPDPNRPGQKIADPEAKAALQTIHRAMRSAVIPRGPTARLGRPPVGVRIGQQEVPLPTDVSSEGIVDPWDDNDNFSWHVPERADTQELVANMRRDGDKLWVVTENATTGTTFTASPHPDLNPAVRRAMARELEIRYPALREVRRRDENTLHEDSRPLDIGFGEVAAADSKPGDPGASMIPYVSNQQQGIAGEFAINDFMDRMKELGLMDPNDHRRYWPEEVNKPYAPLDWIVNGWGIEVKSSSMRDFVLETINKSASVDYAQGHRKREAATKGTWWQFNMNKNLTAAQTADFHERSKAIEKAAKAKNWKEVDRLEAKAQKDGLATRIRRSWEDEADDIFRGQQADAGRREMHTGATAKGMKPAAVQPLVDADNDVVHLFFYEYPEEESSFDSVNRIPVGMTRRLAEGTLNPGDWATPEGGKRDPSRRTIYVGAFPLRANPLLPEDIGLDAPRMHEKARTRQGFKARLARSIGQADIGIQPGARVHTVPEAVAAGVSRGGAVPASEIKDAVTARVVSERPKRRYERKSAPKPPRSTRGRSTSKRSKFEDFANATPEDRLIVELHNQGLSQNQIAERVGYAGNGPVSRRLGVLRSRYGPDVVPEAAPQGTRIDIIQQRKQGIAVPRKIINKAQTAVNKAYRVKKGETPLFTFKGANIVGITKLRAHLKAQGFELTNAQIDELVAALRRAEERAGRLTPRGD